MHFFVVLPECIISLSLLKLYFRVTHEVPEDDGRGIIYSCGSCFTSKSYQLLCTEWQMPLSAEEENHEKKVQNQIWWCICNMIRKNVNMAPGTEIQMLNT